MKFKNKCLEDDIDKKVIILTCLFLHATLT